MAGNANSGRWQEKPFRDALRLELLAAGEDNKALRAIAKALISKAETGDIDQTGPAVIRELHAWPKIGRNRRIWPESGKANVYNTALMQTHSGRNAVAMRTHVGSTL